MFDADEWTENDIQALKAQDAKDLAIELLNELRNKERGPVSPGEVQLRELEFELKLKEAAQADERHRLAHEIKIREFELDIEREKTRQAELEKNADRIRAQFAKLVEQVRNNQEALGIQLERSTREHRLKIEQLQSDYQQQFESLRNERTELEKQRDAIRAEIAELTDLHDLAKELSHLRESVEASQRHLDQQRRSIEEQLSELEHEKTKKVTATKRAQELDLARLESEHEKQKIKMNREVAESILSQLGLRSISQVEWDALQSQLQESARLSDEQLERARSESRQSVLREYNITSGEPVNVTDLYYRNQSVQSENETFRKRIEKLENEIQRARQHIENEPARIATAVEAARTQVQNIVEPSGKR